MPRLSIDITAQQHQQLKTVAAMHGQTIKDYVLKRTFNDMPDPANMTEEEAMDALRGLLEDRLAQARDGQTVTRSAEDIKKMARDVRDGSL